MPLRPRSHRTAVCPAQRTGGTLPSPYLCKSRWVMRVDEGLVCRHACTKHVGPLVAAAQFSARLPSLLREFRRSLHPVAPAPSAGPGAPRRTRHRSYLHRSRVHLGWTCRHPYHRSGLSGTPSLRGPSSVGLAAREVVPRWPRSPVPPRSSWSLSYAGPDPAVAARSAARRLSARRPSGRPPEHQSPR